MASTDEPPLATTAADPGKSGKGARKNDPTKVLDQIKSLDPSDDERTQLSKKISWILRHGAQQKKVDVKISDDGWVKVADLVGVEILGTITEQHLMKVIIDSNGQKLRYEVKEDKKAKATFVRAYSKDKRRSLENGNAGGSAPAQQASQPPTPSTAAAAAAAAGYLPGLGYPGGAAAAAAAQQAVLAARQDPGALAAMMAQAQMSYAGLSGMPPMFPPQYGGYWPPFFPPYSAYSGMAAAAAQSQAQQQQAAAANASGRFLGRIKSYNSEKGFGFIECPVTKKQFDRDVFVHKAQIANFKVGEEVTFMVELSKQNWPQAKDLQYAGAGYQQGGQGGGGKDRRKRGGEKGGEKGEGKGGNAGKGKGKEKREKKDKKEAGAKAAAAGGSKDPKPAAEAAETTEAAPAAAEASSTS
mmetsp:Transcript_18725/g.33881  ORF Transcript_18725/g.33881 Transcript_18725/m.33881 type:complete len:413 (+) Transcript_18725:125-1363(+)